jgi:lipopolysaccharide transport protein LptA
MSAYISRASFAVLLVTASLLPTRSPAQTEAAATVFTFSCDNADIDLRNNRSVCTHVTVSNGTIRILADKGTTNESNLESSRWEFEGNVFIEFETASISAQAATFEFENNQLVFGELAGDPVEIRDRLEEQNVDISGSASRITYNNRDGTARLAGEVSIARGANEYLGCDLIYNLNEKSINAGSSDCGVTVRILPNEEDESAPGDSSPAP